MEAYRANSWSRVSLGQGHCLCPISPTIKFGNAESVVVFEKVHKILKVLRIGSVSAEPIWAPIAELICPKHRGQGRVFDRNSLDFGDFCSTPEWRFSPGANKIDTIEQKDIPLAVASAKAPPYDKAVVIYLVCRMNTTTVIGKIQIPPRQVSLIFCR